MDDAEVELFRERAKQMVDYAAEYLKTIRKRRVLPDVEPGYLQKLIPNHAPDDPDKWDDVMGDIERVIMPGVTHWHSPHFHAYFPTANSHPAICADILSDAIACVGFSWISSPACTELEVAVLNWLGKMLNLPEEFLSSSGGKGGGVIQGTASEATLICILAAKNCAIQCYMDKQNDDPDALSFSEINEKLIAYSSDQAHSSIERAGLLSGIEIRPLPSDENCSLRGQTLLDAIERDKEEGRIPFMVITTLGSTSSLGFDNLQEIGPITAREDLWMHIDAAYAGSAFICPEYRPILNGIEYAKSFNFNPHKWLKVNFDCSALWVKNSDELTQAFVVDPQYLRHEQHEANLPDYRHWQIPLGRRFRSLKLWFVLRLFGVKQLQEHIRHHVKLAKQFEELVRSDPRFEVVYPVVLGLVCFKLKGGNDINEELLKRINDGGQIHLVASTVKGVYLLRFAVCSSFTQLDDVNFAWREISSQASIVQMMATHVTPHNGH